MKDLVMAVGDGAGGRKYAAQTFISREDMEVLGWGAFALLDRALRLAAWELGWPAVARWELRWAQWEILLDGWVVRLQVWPPYPDLDW